MTRSQRNQLSNINLTEVVKEINHTLSQKDNDCSNVDLESSTFSYDSYKHTAGAGVEQNLDYYNNLHSGDLSDEIYELLEEIYQNLDE